MEHFKGALSERDVAVLAADLGLSLTAEQVRQTLGYVRLLGRWNATTSLVQAGSWEELMRRHVAEGWLAATLLDASPEPGEVLDIGSGGGIPAIPMAILRPNWSYTLLEPRQRKAAFLAAALRELPTQAQVWPRRLDEVEPRTWEVVSFRGIRLEPIDVVQIVRPLGLVIRFPGSRDEAGDWAEHFSRVAVRELPTPPLQVELWRRG